MKNKLRSSTKTALTLIALLSVEYINYVYEWNRIIYSLLLLLLGILFYYLYQKGEKYQSLSITCLSHLFAFFMIMGHSYLTVGSWNLIFGGPETFVYSLVTYLGFYFAFDLGLKKLFWVVDQYPVDSDESKMSKLKRWFHKYPFLISLLVLLICWLPYILAFYPAILSPDPTFQIKQFLGIPNKYSDYVILLDPNVIITNHHPVLQTILLGGLTKIGIMLGSINLGLFLHSLVQIVVMSSVLAYTIYYMNKQKVSFRYQLLMLVLYSLNPVFPFYVMSAVKDTIFSAFVILYILYLYDFIKHQKQLVISIGKMVRLILLMVLITLFRNNGVYIVLLSFPFIIMICKNLRMKLFFAFGCTLLIYYSFNNLLLSSLKITDGSIREMLSIPFQQTARYVKEHSKEMTTYELETINKILDVDTLADRYKPEIADPVKNEYNRYATNEDLKKYFKVWFLELTKHPDTYIQATLNNTYGYVYPEAMRWYIYYPYYSLINEDGFDYHYNGLSGLRSILSAYGISFPFVPVIGLMNRVGMNVWLSFILIGYIIHIKKYKYIIYVLPAIITFLVCLASPVNTYYRYIMPIALAMPLMIGLLIDLKRREEK